MQLRTAVLAAGLSLAAAPLPAFAQAAPLGRAQAGPRIVTEEARIPAGDPGVEIYVRNKHPADLTASAPGRTLVFVHGATYPASTSFDLELGGESFMDELAGRGFDVYLLDLPGYGHSTRPAAMDQPAAANPPFETTADAVRHYGAVVNWVLRRRGISRLDVMGWSWGTTIAAGYAAAQPDKVERLVLYAPVWIVQGGPGAAADEPKLGAYRTVTAEAARQRWLTGVPQDKQASLIPEGWFDAWQRATWATDPGGSAQAPPVLRAPNGVMQDLRAFWRAGKPSYDPARITAPTLLVHGEWDHDTPPYMAQTLFPLLTAAPWKRYVEIGEGTHTIMMEKNRHQLFAVVGAFLTDPDPEAP